MCIYNMRKKQKKKSEKGSVYTYTQNSGKKAFMCIYTKGKKKREKGKIKSLYICTPKKDRKEKRKTPVYMHTKLLEESACVHLYRGKEKRGCGYIYTLKRVVCAAITAERKTKEKMEKKKRKKKSGPATLILHCFFEFLCFADVCTIYQAAMRKGAKEKEKRERRKGKEEKRARRTRPDAYKNRAGK